MVVGTETISSKSTRSVGKFRLGLIASTLVLTDGAVPSRLPTLSACDAVGSRRRSSNEHRDKARTDAILAVFFCGERLGVCGVCGKENKKWIGRAPNICSLSRGRRPGRVIYTRGVLFPVFVLEWLDVSKQKQSMYLVKVDSAGELRAWAVEASAAHPTGTGSHEHYDVAAPAKLLKESYSSTATALGEKKGENTCHSTSLYHGYLS